MANLTDIDVGIIETPEVVAAKEMVASEQNQHKSRLGVIIGGQKVLVQLTDISEVLPLPPLQVVPLTKAWYLGVTNVRGSLYSVTDLAQFLQWPPIQKNISNRIVLLNSIKTTQAAVLIDAVVGLRNIDAMELAQDKAELIHASWQEKDIRCFSPHIYQDHDESLWFALDVDALVQDPRFVQPSIA